MIQVIPTKYNGILFRSRTEARWAVLFDILNWKWHYEAEGYSLPSGYYLPDFYFPDFNMFAEVKGKEFTTEEVQKCKELSMLKTADDFYHVVLMLPGAPNKQTYNICLEGEDNKCPATIEHANSKYSPLYYSGDYEPNANYERAVEIALSYRFHTR